MSPARLGDGFPCNEFQLVADSAQVLQPGVPVPNQQQWPEREEEALCRSSHSAAVQYDLERPGGSGEIAISGYPRDVEADALHE